MRAYLVNADDIAAAIAAIRSLDGMEDALISVDQEGPIGDVSWLVMPVNTARRIF